MNSLIFGTILLLLAPVFLGGTIYLLFSGKSNRRLTGIMGGCLTCLALMFGLLTLFEYKTGGGFRTAQGQSFEFWGIANENSIKGLCDQRSAEFIVIEADNPDIVGKKWKAICVNKDDKETWGEIIRVKGSDSHSIVVRASVAVPEMVLHNKLEIKGFLMVEATVPRGIGEHKFKNVDVSLKSQEKTVQIFPSRDSIPSMFWFLGLK